PGGVDEVGVDDVAGAAAHLLAHGPVHEVAGTAHGDDEHAYLRCLGELGHPFSTEDLSRFHRSAPANPREARGGRSGPPRTQQVEREGASQPPCTQQVLFRCFSSKWWMMRLPMASIEAPAMAAFTAQPTTGMSPAASRATVRRPTLASSRPLAIISVSPCDG